MNFERGFLYAYGDNDNTKNYTNTCAHHCHCHTSLSKREKADHSKTIQLARHYHRPQILHVFTALYVSGENYTTNTNSILISYIRREGIPESDTCMH